MNNSRILAIRNAKFSGYFYMNLNIWGDFHICISVPLICTLARFCLVLCCYSWKVSFVCVLQLITHPLPISPCLLYHKKLFYMLFFFCLKLLVTLFMQLFCNNIYVSTKNEGADLLKTVQFFDFHFIPNCLKAFKV